MSWAKRLLRELPKKIARDGPELLLRRRSYVDPVFCDLLHKHLDAVIYHDPQEGLRWAKVGPDHAALLTPEKGPVRLPGRDYERLVRAWVILGSAYRAAGDPATAEGPYRRALALIDAETISELLRAETHSRLAVLRVCQGRKDEALEQSTDALATLRKVADEETIAEALVGRGHILETLGRLSEASACFSEALSTTNRKASPRSQRIHLTATHNLGYVISRSRHADKRGALLFVRQAQKLLMGRRRSVERYRLLWVEGLIWASVGCERKAEKSYRAALKGFEILELPWEIALVALDLGAVMTGEWPELAKLAGETHKRFRSLAGGDTEALAALSQWTSAISAEKLTDEVTGKAREVIVAGVFKGARMKRARRKQRD